MRYHQQYSALKDAPMITFAELTAHPDRLTDAMRSPTIHADGTMTLLWEGMPPVGPLFYQGEWMEHPAPLTYLEECDIWGADIIAPPLPPTVCSWLRIGEDATFLRASLPSWRHTEALLGPDLPPLTTPQPPLSSLFAEVPLPTPTLATPSRRIRLFAPGATYGDALYVLDGETFAGPDADFPAATDGGQRAGAVPPTLVVAVASGGANRLTEFLRLGTLNAVARTWFMDDLVPYITATYGVQRHWLVGTSSAASFALQLLLDPAGVFAGGVCCSPWHQDGYESLATMAESWTGDGRIFISHGDFGFGETANLPRSRALAVLLRQRGHAVRYHEAIGYGHTFASWSRILPIGLAWLFALT
jgi:enterochelin esterase-like enzyme